MSPSLFTIFLSGLAGGFAAVLMPCIFPMLPLTVGYFAKGNTSQSRNVVDACLYGLFIVLIYVGAGLLITLISGADALNALATNGFFNFFFFLLLVVFAFSYLGGFEITLPSKWINQTNRQSERKGIAGLFFMAATLALVSFSCTGPIVGTLLVQAATLGKILSPAIGMLGFSIALALPFVLFAFFPKALAALPKSGGWLNEVKVVLGFLELALSFKFLSNVDLTYHWHLFDREIFLVLWITIFAMTGFYLLGKLRFGYDKAVSSITIPRLAIAIITFSFTLYMVPGLWGAPLKAIAAFLPPQQTQDFDLYSLRSGSQSIITVKRSPKKYEQLFHAPLGLDAFFDYEEGMSFAQKMHKPVMIDFTGHSCVNCRKMEATVWPDKDVFKHLSDDYVLIQLYVDDKTALPLKEQYTSSFSHKHIETIGQKWCDLQASRFNENSQPFYVLLDGTGKLLETPEGADYDASSYNQFLEKGLKKFTN
jgi:thiol:disulfide interchange protein